MKPTSIIFLILSLILFFGGYVTLGIAKTMASSSNTPIYDQTFDENGDAVYTYNISSNTISKLLLTFSDVDLTIVGNAEESYVELKNFETTSYATSLSAGTVTVNGNTSFLSSLIDMSDGGVSFRGIRYFLLDKPDPSRARSVTVYISELSEIKTIAVSLAKGSVTFKNIPNTFDYSISVTEGNVVLENVDTDAVANITVHKGNVDIKDSAIATMTITQEEGTTTLNAVDAYAPELTTYDLRTEDGTVRYNGVPVGTEYKITSPAPKNNIKINSKSGTIIVSDSGDHASIP